MKTKFAIAVLGCITLIASAQSNVPPVIFPGTNAHSFNLVWPQTPGLRYEVQQSTNLQSWTTAPGYPATASGPAQQMSFAATNGVMFYQVRALDEQPPAIASRYPQDGAFAVPRFSDITMQLSDATGINTNSIQFTVGGLGTFTLGDTNLNYTNGVLTFLNGGSVPLGGWGSNITATLILADTLGYAATNTWRFDLEVQPQVVSNLFVFGSPQAQRAGQQVGNIPTRVLARRFGPIPMGAGDPWTLELVASNRLEISYTNIAPPFALNQYVCNLTPASPDEIFNRKITNITDDPGNKRLTLYTVEVPLTEIATNGTVSITANSVILQTGTNGAFNKAFEIGGTITFPRVGYSLDGTEFTLKDSGDFDLVNLTLEEQHWWLTPRLQVELEVDWGQLKRFEAIASGNVEVASVFDADFLLAGVALDATLFDLPEPLEPKTWMFLGSIGPVPVYASLGFDVQLKGRAEVHSTLNFHAGMRQTMDATFGLIYAQPTGVQWVNTFNFPPPEVIPFTANINAEGSVKVSLEPALEFLVYGLAGVSAGITPSGDVTFETGTGQPLSGRMDADVTLDLGPAGPAFDLLSPKPELSLSIWHDEWHLFPDDPMITFTTQPQNQTVQLGGSAYFFCTVTAPQTPAYQWYFNGIPMSGQTARTLSLPSVSYGHAGNYQVRVTAGGQSSISMPATLTVASAVTPPSMALIPAGSFVMGNCMDPNEGFSSELPLHTVYVSAFYMDQYDVTEGLWAQVYNWATNHGYSFDHAGSGKAANHPVQSVDWYDCVKWCNARSEMEGRMPTYYTTSAQTTVYRTGQVDMDNNSVKWNAGYRLPTEAEWEKAARGGVSGQRFPWGNTISWNQANYYGYPLSLTSSGYSYDLATAIGYDPTFNDGVYPYTSPVGSFAPNGYGLYDMAGNVWQWCWDWYGAYSSGSQTDPRGPTSGSGRVNRGGCYNDYAFSCRTANRYNLWPDISFNYVGFRSVLTPGQ